MNRAYVGEQRIPDPAKKGDPRVIPKSHQPLVTEAEWEAANAVKGRAPTHNGLAAKTYLKGIVRCGICAGTMHVCAYGKARDKMTLQQLQHTGPSGQRHEALAEDILGRTTR